MGKNDKLAVKFGKQFWNIAEKVVEGLLESGFVRETHSDRKRVAFNDTSVLKNKLIEAVAEAMKRNLTYGNLGTITMRNNNGQIVAKLYVLPDGTLADDSWLCNRGWKH